MGAHFQGGAAEMHVWAMLSLGKPLERSYVAVQENRELSNFLLSSLFAWL
jgi:hypothetical protein